jgi:hypothetical protein
MVWVKVMANYNKKGMEKKYPSLYEAFELGDRVKRIYKNKNGKKKEYKGIVLAIEESGIEIYWDTLDGKYRPNNMGMAFTSCPIDEIFKGSKEYSPIEKESRL